MVLPYKKNLLQGADEDRYYLFYRRPLYIKSQEHGAPDLLVAIDISSFCSPSACGGFTVQKKAGSQGSCPTKNLHTLCVLFLQGADEDICRPQLFV